MTDPTGAFDRIQNAEPDTHGCIVRSVIPLRSTIVYPRLITPIAVPDGRALNAARHAQHNQQTVIGIAMRNPEAENPSIDDLYAIGTEMVLGNLITMPGHRQTALVEGRRRVEVVETLQTDPFILVRARVLEEIVESEHEVQALRQVITTLFQQTTDSHESFPEEVIEFVMGMDDPGWLADFLVTTFGIDLPRRQQFLEMLLVDERMRQIAALLNQELNVQEIRNEISGQVQEEITRNQRETILREQMRVIQNELGEYDIYQQDLIDLREQIETADLTAEARDKAYKELTRLEMMPPIAPEVGIIRTYLDWLVSLPWTKTSIDNLDVTRAQKVLDAEHHGLPKVKDRILEHIAVRKLAADKMKSPILCFVGPPGVGKTSLGQSIASALGREFVRVSLGGVRDEAEIRGHRRTYIGAMPGRIIQTMRRAGTINPVFMLDEIDKLGTDFRGDPAAALLEALDPEQNKSYSDHYMDLPYDLSKVLFITTANDLYPIPPALLDRMEVIEFPGYTEEDKIEIARAFLIPRQLEAHGIDREGIRFDTSALQTIIREYTYEAGVRNLNREIGRVFRKVARLKAENKPFPRRMTGKKVNELLGPPEYLPLRANEEDSVGIATGVAWTSGGGDILTIEVSILPGKGTLLLTGQLGEVMQESAQAALSYMRSRAKELDVPNDDFENYDVHIHLPEGAVPKDGPSAGITLAAAIISAFTERKVRSDYAMTGEITLRGRVLPVGGVKEKILAAHRARIVNIILPEQNRKDLQDVPAKALQDMNIIFVNNMQQVIDLVLLDPPIGGRERDKDRNDQDSDEDKDEKS